LTSNLQETEPQLSRNE